jgi:hypothetical protein
MDGVTGDVLEHATGHGFRRRLVLRRRNVKRKLFSLTLARGDDEGGCGMAAFLCSPFSGIGGAVRWSSVVRTGSDCSGVTSSCSESVQGAPGQHVEERQW